MRNKPKITVGKGERVLAWCEANRAAGDPVVLAGTRDAFYVGDEVRLAWEEVEAADWNRDTSVFALSEVGNWGEQRVEHRFTISETGRLLELVRERVTASVVLQRHVPIRGIKGVRVIARRAPAGNQPLHWIYEFDEGIDPADREVQARAAAALKAAREEIGLN